MTTDMTPRPAAARLSAREDAKARVAANTSGTPFHAPMQSVYTDPALLERELAAVFDRDWVMIGRQGSIPKPGDYLTAMVGRRPVAIVRQQDGSIRAFANFCLHRYAKLLEGQGNAKRIVCPYHAWTYDIEGRLIGVTEREGFPDVCRGETRLVELACEVWLGFVFVALDRDIDPIGKRLAPLGDLLAHYDLGSYEDRYLFNSEIWGGNWKLVYENFVECYHVTYAHKRSIGPTNPTDLTEMGPSGHRQFSIHYNPYQPDSYPEVHNAALDADERRRLHVIGLYPNGLVAIDANFVWWMMLEPQAVDRTNGRWGLSFSPLAMSRMKDPEAYAAEIRRVIAVATEEDKEVVARVHAGCGFGAPSPGYLHTSLELYVAEFRSYLDRMLGAATAAR